VNATLLRLEVLRLRRTRRLVPLLAVFLLSGFGGPLLARYLPDLLESQTSENLTVIAHEARPVDGISMFTSNADQLGLLVALVIAAGILAVDARPGLAAFYRTRVRPFDRVLFPRYVVTSTVVSGSYVLGALAAWYETAVLIGPIDAGRYLLGTGLTVVYLWFAVGVVVLTTSFVRSVAGAAAGAIGILLALPIVGLWPAAEPWLPSTLVGAHVAMVRADPAGDYLPTAGATVAATAVILLVATRRLRHREV
jgi:ABC-2 type transport system permease protein